MAAVAPTTTPTQCTCVRVRLQLMLEKDVCAHCVAIRDNWPPRAPGDGDPNDALGTGKTCYLCYDDDPYNQMLPLACCHTTAHDTCIKGLYHCGVCSITWTATPDSAPWEAGELHFGGPHRKLAGHRYECDRWLPLYCPRDSGIVRRGATLPRTPAELK